MEIVRLGETQKVKYFPTLNTVFKDFESKNNSV